MDERPRKWGFSSHSPSLVTLHERQRTGAFATGAQHSLGSVALVVLASPKTDLVKESAGRAGGKGGYRYGIGKGPKTVNALEACAKSSKLLDFVVSKKKHPPGNPVEPIVEGSVA